MDSENKLGSPYNGGQLGQEEMVDWKLEKKMFEFEFKKKETI